MFSLLGPGQRHAFYGMVNRFGPARREHDFLFRLGIQKTSHLTSGFFQGRSGLGGDDGKRVKLSGAERGHPPLQPYEYQYPHHLSLGHQGMGHGRSDGLPQAGRKMLCPYIVSVENPGVSVFDDRLADFVLPGEQPAGQHLLGNPQGGFGSQNAGLPVRKKDRGHVGVQLFDGRLQYQVEKEIQPDGGAHGFADLIERNGLLQIYVFPVEPLFLQPPLDHRPQGVHGEGFDQIIVGPGPEHGHRILYGGMSGHEDHYPVRVVCCSTSTPDFLPMIRSVSTRSTWLVRMKSKAFSGSHRVWMR